MNKFFKGTVTALFFIFVAVYFLLPIETEDIWWHLKAGEYIVQNHQVPHFDPFPFSTEVTPWVLTQWGGSLFYYTVYHFFGLDGLRVTRVILGLLTFALFLAYSSRKIPFAFSLLLTLIIFFPIEARSFLRPDFFNFIFVQIFLIALFAHRDAKNWKPLWVIPLTGIFWVNIHIGSFMYGFLVMGIFLFHYFIQHLQATNAKRVQESKELVKKIEQLGAITAIYLLLFFLTPYGLEGFLYPFKVLFVKDYLHFDAVSKHITELIPPIHLLTWYYFWFYMLTVLVLVSLIKFKSDRFLYTLLFAFGLYMFFYSVRAGAFFALVCGYIITQKWKSFKFSPVIEQGLLSAILLILIFMTIQGVNNIVYINGKTYRRHFNLTQIPDNPSSALKVLDENNMKGLVFNDMSYGGYMLWHSYPDLRPFADSRFSDLPAFFTYMAIYNNPADAWPSFEKSSQVKIVLVRISRPTRKLVTYFMKDPNWVLIFVERDCVLFVKKGAFNLPDKLTHYRDNLEQKNLRLGEINSRIPNDTVRENSFPPYLYVDLKETAISLFNLGFKGAALETMAESLQVSDDSASRDKLHQMRQHLK